MNCREVILKLMQLRAETDGEWMTAADVYRDTDFGYSTIRVMLKRLTKEGLLRSRESGDGKVKPRVEYAAAEAA